MSESGDESRLLDDDRDSVPPAPARSNKDRKRSPWCTPRTAFFCVGGLFAFVCIVASIVVPVVLLFVDEQQFDPAIQACSADAARLIQTATSNSTSQAMGLLTNVTDMFGPRMTGSSNLEGAIDHIVATMRQQGLQNVRKEPVTVVNWRRGNETLVMQAPFYKSMQILGLGGTCNTSDSGIEAVVLVVSSEAELRSLSGVAPGKIVLFNAPFTTYGDTVRYRVNAAQWAASVGAVAALVRSITPFSLYTPHTGVMATYSKNASIPRIPAAAVTLEDAELLRRLTQAGVVVTLRLRIVGDDGYDANGVLRTSTSYNVVGEVTGAAADQVVVVGGHIDSWDVGQGAIDDMGGFVAAWEAVRIVKSLNIPLLRTLRVVGWVAEENNGAGAQQYARDHINDTTVFAFESDDGINAPTGIDFAGVDGAFSYLNDVSQLLALLQTNAVSRVQSAPSADTGPLYARGVPSAALRSSPSANYFYYHHTNADTPDKIVETDLRRSAATFAVYAVCVANANNLLPRAPTTTTTTTTLAPTTSN